MLIHRACIAVAVIMSLLTLPSCREAEEDDTKTFPGNYTLWEVIISQDEAEQYVANNSYDHKSDSGYMNTINSLLESEAQKHSLDTNFVRFVKSVATGESDWLHYVYKDGKYYVIAFLNRDIGLMQINTAYFPKYGYIEANAAYGVSVVYDVYSDAVANDCASGTNQGGDLESIIRRAYASYNGGPGVRCRDNHENDTAMWNIFVNEPWKGYL
jgi:hypothetical protein